MLVSGVKNCSVHNEMVGVVWCVADQVWWATLCQKVQSYFLAPFPPDLIVLTKGSPTVKKRFIDIWNVILFWNKCFQKRI